MDACEIQMLDYPYATCAFKYSNKKFGIFFLQFGVIGTVLCSWCVELIMRVHGQIKKVVESGVCAEVRINVQKNVKWPHTSSDKCLKKNLEVLRPYDTFFIRFLHFICWIQSLQHFWPFHYAERLDAHSQRKCLLH